MNRKIQIAYAFFVIAIFAVSLFVLLNSGHGASITLAGQKVNVEVVNTQKTRELGLSGHAPLEENSGMLFIFDRPGEYVFWMKDMTFAIDMIWLSEDLKVVYIKENATPESYPNESFGPAEDTLYVLEVPAGFSQINNLKVGDTAVLEL